MTDTTNTSLRSHRAYQVLLLVELLLTIIVLALSIATALGVL